MIRIELTNSFNGEDAVLVGAAPDLRTALEDGRLHGSGMKWDKLVLAVNRGWAFLVSGPSCDGTRVAVGVVGQATVPLDSLDWNCKSAGSRES